MATAVLAVAGTVISGGISSASSSIKGGACFPKGITTAYMGDKYTCVLVGKKLEWNAGVPIPTTTTTTLPGLNTTANFDNTPAGPLIWSEDFGNASDTGANTTPFFSDSDTYYTGTVQSTTPVTKYWSAVTGYGTYGTGEIENNVTSAATEDGLGNLVITATCVSVCTSANQSMGQTWTSARIWTEGKATFQYGQLEAKIWMPAGSYNWPAFWMMGENYYSANGKNATPWPNCGELDIAEGLQNNTQDQMTIHANIPGFSQDWDNGSGLSAIVPQTRLSTAQMTGAFHTYGILWKPNSITFTLDGKEWASDTYVTKAQGNLRVGDVVQTVGASHFVVGPGQPNASAGGDWPFNAAFFLIFNNAIGGVSSPIVHSGDASTSQMKIQWIKYYKYDGYGTFTSIPQP